MQNHKWCIWKILCTLQEYTFPIVFKWGPQSSLVLWTTGNAWSNQVKGALKFLLFPTSWVNAITFSFHMQWLRIMHSETYTSKCYLKVNVATDIFVSDLLIYVGFEVLMATSMKMAVFWVIVPCSLVEVYWHFRGAYSLRNVGKLLPDYTVLQPRRHPSSYLFMS
jgi:hypothetical protein